uniref:Uncharacterized protein n=1 Tax=Rhizophora mucronata TaxID=61149 RepID=A0A2P2LFA2_RHIMU
MRGKNDKKRKKKRKFLL